MDLDKKFEAWLKKGRTTQFNPVIKERDDWKFLEKVIPGLQIVTADGFAPFQAEGFIHELPFYFRLRHGTVMLQVGQLSGDAVNGHILYSVNVMSKLPETHGGFATLMLELVPNLEKMPFQWKFSSNVIEVEEDWSAKTNGYKTTLYGWGHTPEEALEYVKQDLGSRFNYDCTPEMRENIWRLRDVNPTPLNEDNRIKPFIEPIFTVNI
jgi:hypothetical protein